MSLVGTQSSSTSTQPTVHGANGNVDGVPQFGWGILLVVISVLTSGVGVCSCWFSVKCVRNGCECKVIFLFSVFGKIVFVFRKLGLLRNLSKSMSGDVRREVCKFWFHEVI